MTSLAVIASTLTSETALSAFASTGFISLVPNVLLFLFPALTTMSNEESPLWQWGQALAAGGLMGDVFLHTLPHILLQEAEHVHQLHHHHQNQQQHHRRRRTRQKKKTDHQHHTHDHHDHHQHDSGMGTWILAGFSIFFLVDILLHMIEDAMQDQLGKSTKATHVHTTPSSSLTNHHSSKENLSASMNNTASRHVSWSLVVLNVAADALHNFSDGLAIGAAYGSGAGGMGQVATISILLHEVPHELGDYCTLVAAGYTPWQAVRTQFGTAVAALVGTAVAIIIQQDAQQGRALMLASAGGFLYLAASTLLPHVMHHRQSTPWHRLSHVVAFAVGVAFMYAVAWFEHNDPQHSHQHHYTEL